MKALRIALPVFAFLGVISGYAIGLFHAPPEVGMGDVQRLMYVHVPAVWMAMICATLNVGACIWYLIKSDPRADYLAEASGEVGLLFISYGLMIGSIWARPTWGVWWTWDPRLTSAAVMIVAYMGYLALRRFVDDPEKRAVWSAAAGILAYLDIPIVWFSVRWWRSLHQVQSSPATVDPQIVLPLRWNGIAVMLTMITFLIYRYGIARARHAAETAVPSAGAGAKVGLTPTGSAS